MSLLSMMTQGCPKKNTIKYNPKSKKCININTSSGNKAFNTYVKLFIGKDQKIQKSRTLDVIYQLVN